MNTIKVTSKEILFETVKYILENATIKSEIPNDIFNCGYSFENNGFELDFTSIPLPLNEKFDLTKTE